MNYHISNLDIHPITLTDEELYQYHFKGDTFLSVPVPLDAIRWLREHENICFLEKEFAKQIKIPGIVSEMVKYYHIDDMGKFSDLYKKQDKMPVVISFSLDSDGVLVRVLLGQRSFIDTFFRKALIDDILDSL